MTGSAPLPMLPGLAPEEAAHARGLEALIRERIEAAGGWIDFETFMDLALYAPGQGYYSAGSVKLGRGGDFVTAPEVSELFGRCLARQVAQILAQVPEGAILEFGAGSGRLAATLLRELAQLGQLPRRYDILEISADLAERQRAEIARLPESLSRRVNWLTRLPALPSRGVVIANEVLDALPCQRFLVGEAGTEWEIAALGVTAAEDGSLRLQKGAPCASLRTAWAQLQGSLQLPLAPGYRSELCARVEPWISSLAAVLEQGVMLLFDYGLPRAQYYHPERSSGTLCCHFKHRVHYDPLINTGVQDITAWVDFTRVALAGQAAGLDVLGFCTQAAFLLGTGIEELLSHAQDHVERIRLAGEARRLLLPGEMGEAFKLIALGQGWAGGALDAFAHQDLRHSL